MCVLCVFQERETNKKIDRVGRERGRKRQKEGDKNIGRECSGIEGRTVCKKGKDGLHLWGKDYVPVRISQ